MWQNIIVTCILILCVGLVGDAQAQDYNVTNLVRNLLKIGYPLEREDVIALDKIGMQFGSKNRITVLEEILRKRDFIHSRNDDFFIKTEIIIDALRLLDEHDLPVVYKLVDELNQQDGWEVRERALLAFMAAKRDIRYQSNAAFLLKLLPQYGSDLERIYSGETSHAIIDVMNCLSYLADLFVYKGDTDILNSLILYSSRAYGYPAEYLSHMFIDMFLLRPKVFISTLAVKDDRIVNTVIKSLIFGIRNNQVRAEVKAVLQKDLFAADEPNQGTLDLIIKKCSRLSPWDNSSCFIRSNSSSVNNPCLR
jgi:hypothetical protein